MAARRIPDPKVGGSNPSGLTVCFVFWFFVLGSETGRGTRSSAAAPGVHSSAVERRIADPEVAGSIPVAPWFPPSSVGRAQDS